MADQGVGVGDGLPVGGAAVVASAADVKGPNPQVWGDDADRPSPGIGAPPILGEGVKGPAAAEWAPTVVAERVGGSDGQ